MRTLGLIAAGWAVLSFGTLAPAQTRVVTAQGETYVCPQCGKIHRRAASGTTVAKPTVVETPTKASTIEVKPTTQAAPTTQTVPSETVSNEVSSPKETAAPVTVRKVSYESAAAGSVPVASSSALVATGGVTNVLASLNAQRSRQGVPQLRYDPQLQAVAQRRVQQMARSGLKNHPPGSFAPGRYEGVGWSSSYSPSGVSACYTSDSRMRYAGASMATGRDGVYFAVVYR